MAAFVNRKNNFCLLNKNTAYLFDIREDGLAEESFTCKKTVEPESKGLSNKPDEGSDRILACGLSCDGQYLVACDDYKQIWVWNHDLEAEQWNLVYRREMARRATSLTFAGNDVLVADKSGDVTVFSLLSDNEGSMLLGHVSILLDIVMLEENGKQCLVATCDRDEKIRISRYPNAYHIQAYCLGHTEFVSRLGAFTSAGLLVSGSGDGTVRLWNYITGVLLYTLDLKTEFPELLESNGSQSNEKELGQEMDQSENSKVGQAEGEGCAEESEGIMSRTKGQADVKCLACCHRNQTIAIGLDKRDVALILKLRTNDSTKPEVHISQRIAVPSSDIRALCFDEAGALWVVERGGTASVRVFTYDSANGMYAPLTSNADTRGVLRVAEKINQNHEQYFLDGLAACSTTFDFLHKVRIDNMSDYQKRKEARVAQNKQRRMRAGVTSSGQDGGEGEGQNGGSGGSEEGGVCESEESSDVPPQAKTAKVE